VSELAILVPVLGRPHRVKQLLESIEAATPEPHRVLFIADAGDDDELAALDDAGAERLVLEPPVNWAQKINAGYGATSEPLLFIAADDLAFHPEWFARARSYFRDGIEIVGTNDICNPRVMTGQHATHMLIRRSYIEEQSGVADEPGKVVHEGYPHEYADDELIQTAMGRGVYAHAFDSIVEHLHPLVDKAPDDETYRLGRSQTKIGKRLFYRRRYLWMNPSP
jgi:glycosyltransferase involved in cell wall biosynthesis